MELLALAVVHRSLSANLESMVTEIYSFMSKMVLDMNFMVWFYIILKC